MTPQLQLFMVLGALMLLCIIFTLLKRGLMSVKYSLLWLLLAVALVIAAAFPYVIYVLRDVLSIEMPVNLVFLLMFCFVLVVLLSLSIAITQLAEKCKRLTQANAILEKRVRDLEEKNRYYVIKRCYESGRESIHYDDHLGADPRVPVRGSVNGGHIAVVYRFFCGSGAGALSVAAGAAPLLSAGDQLWIFLL